MSRSGPARRVLTSVAGGVLVLVGAALMVLPGPGLILVFAGVAVLANEYYWAQRLREPVRYRAMQAAEASVATPLRIAWSILCGLGLIGLGVVWMVVPALPFSGVGTGSSLILSGILLLALLVYSYRRTRRRDDTGALR